MIMGVPVAVQVRSGLQSIIRLSIGILMKAQVVSRSSGGHRALALDKRARGRGFDSRRDD